MIMVGRTRGDGRAMNDSQFRISVLTATYNAAATLDRLVASLEAQQDDDFEWVVVDGGSTDETVGRADAARLARKIIVSESDFGIYDALNKGLHIATGDYYLVLGADDELAPDAISRYRAALAAASSPPDIVTAAIRSAAGDICHVRPGKAWLYGLQGFVSAHSIGSLIRRDLHQRFGFYSRKFPIAADQLFIKRAAQGGARILCCDFCAGQFGAHGVSSVDLVGTLTEFLRVQLATESGKALQLLLFVVRVLKNYRRL